MTLRLSGLIRPRTIAGQIVILVLVSVGLFHLVLNTTSTLFGERPVRPELGPFAVADRFTEFVRLLDHLPAAVASILRGNDQLRVEGPHAPATVRRRLAH